MAKKKHAKNKPEHEFFESSEALAEKLSKTEEFLEKNKPVVLSVITVIVVLVAGYMFYNYWKNNQNQLAQSEMFQAQYWFEADSLDLSLNGDGNSYGFLEIIDEFGSTDAANISHFYVGVAYLKKGELDNALEHLEKFNSSDKLVQARRFALIGDIYMEKEEYSKAAGYYNDAANHYPNEFFSPGYLMKAALAYEKLSDFQGATKSYDRIINDFSKSGELQNARKHKARIENKASK